MCHKETLVELTTCKAVSQIATKHSLGVYEKSKAIYLAFLFLFFKLNQSWVFFEFCLNIATQRSEFVFDVFWIANQKSWV